MIVFWKLVNGIKVIFYLNVLEKKCFWKLSVTFTEDKKAYVFFICNYHYHYWIFLFFGVADFKVKGDAIILLMVSSEIYN